MQSTCPPITVIADDRERKSGVIESLAAIENVRIRIQRLSEGDYHIDRRLIVERKTLKDFSVSIINGRLFKQMTRLAASIATGVLILEGTAKDLVTCAMKREAMQGALISVSLILGLPVLRSLDASETARIMVYMARQLQTASVGGIHRQGYLPKGRRQRQLFILQGLPGIGVERAARLLDKFGSVEAVISAGKKELQEVSGIGEGLAQKIRWAVKK